MLLAILAVSLSAVPSAMAGKPIKNVIEFPWQTDGLHPVMHTNQDGPMGAQAPTGDWLLLSGEPERFASSGTLVGLTPAWASVSSADSDGGPLLPDIQMPDLNPQVSPTAGPMPIGSPLPGPGTLAILGVGVSAGRRRRR